ncbi:MAG: hypothetical protein RL519_1057, partial [Pseudomonadota bacterium]
IGRENSGNPAKQAEGVEAGKGHGQFLVANELQ